MSSIMAPTSITDQAIAKSGWLLRRSTVVRRWKESRFILGPVLRLWKKSWFVLFKDGRLGYYEDENSSVAEEIVDIPRDRAIIVGPDYCRHVEAPAGKSHDLIFGVKTRGKFWHMCAEDKDNLLAWKLALQESLSAFAQGASNGDGASAYTGYVLPAGHGYGLGNYTIYAPPGSMVTVTDRGPVIYQPDGSVVHVFDKGNPYYRHNGGDAAMGFLTGAALGSMMFWPWWAMWWWF